MATCQEKPISVKYKESILVGFMTPTSEVWINKANCIPVIPMLCFNHR